MAVKRVVLGLISRNGEVLLVQKKSRHNKNLEWFLPGGRVEVGESEERALEREVFEETSVMCKAVKRIGETLNDTGTFLLCYWDCEFKGSDPAVMPSSEIEQYAWIGLKEALVSLGSDGFSPLKTHIEKLLLQQQN